MSYTKENQYAGFWVRVLAQVIDSIVLGIVYVPIQIAMVLLAIPLLGDMSTTSNVNEGPMIIGYLILLFLYLGVSFAYIIMMPASKFQGTFGKKIMGIKIVDEDGGRISVRKSILRYLGMIVSGLTFYIGYIMVAFHPQKRALHDIIAKTHVVSAK